MYCKQLCLASVSKWNKRQSTTSKISNNRFIILISVGTYLTNEAKGAEDAPDADTAIINAEGSQVNAEEKKEYFI